MLKFGDAEFITKLKGSGVTVSHQCVSVDEGLIETLQSIQAWRSVYEKFPDRILITKEFADIHRAKAAGKIAVFLGCQDTSPIEGKLFLLDILRQLGIRFMQLTYQRRNFVGDGCGETTNCGLSKFGAQVVKRMNDLGLVIDLSHVGVRTTLDAIEVSDHPVTVTHSTARGLCDTIRGKTDDEIKALAAKGGVIGIAAKSGFLVRNGINTGSTIDDYIDHIDYVRDLVGIDYVGIGTDLGDERGITKERYGKSHAKYPEIPIVNDAIQVELIHPHGLDSPSKLFNITAGLVRRGYSDGDILKILGGNFLRVFRVVMGE
jgi:microsomal dipeptidase-like Zn-dependent dipeptidase